MRGARAVVWIQPIGHRPRHTPRGGAVFKRGLVQSMRKKARTPRPGSPVTTTRDVNVVNKHGPSVANPHGQPYIANNIANNAGFTAYYCTSPRFP